MTIMDQTTNPTPKPVNPYEQPPQRVEYRPPLVEVVPQYGAAEAARAFVQPYRQEMPVPAEIITEAHYGNLGTMLHQMFIEADSMPPAEMYFESPREQEQPYTNQREMWHEFLGLVMKGMKESEAVTDLRLLARSHPEEINEHHVEKLYRAYENALHKALRVMKPDLVRPQRTELQEAIAHLDWSYKDVIAEHVMAVSAGSELTYEPKDFLILLNPGARKIEYTTTAEAQRLVQHFGSNLNKDALKKDTGRDVPKRLEPTLNSTN